MLNIAEKEKIMNKVKSDKKNVSYERQVYADSIKTKQLRLEEVLAPFCKPEEMIAMKEPAHYKNRVHRMFYHDKNGVGIRSGYISDDYNAPKIEEAYVDDEKCLEIIQTIKGMTKSFKIKTFDIKSGYGLLRYVAVRRAFGTGEIMVTLVLSSIIMPSKNNFTKELRRLHPEITTILISENYKDIDAIYGDKEVKLFGKGFILDSMYGKNFRVGMKSQYTLNPILTEKICETIEKWGAFHGNELVLDAFCGIGTYGIALSDKVRKVLSVETNLEMHRDAISNIKRNNIKNIDVYRNNPAEFVLQVANSEKEKMEVAIISQPYNGCGKEFIDGILKIKPKKIFLLTRNLKKLSDELSLLTRAGYKVKKAAGVDVHPFTERIDTIIMLTL